MKGGASSGGGVKATAPGPIVGLAVPLGVAQAPGRSASASAQAMIHPLDRFTANLLAEAVNVGSTPSPFNGRLGVCGAGLQNLRPTAPSRRSTPYGSFWTAGGAAV
jgi:hypothetical protein